MSKLAITITSSLDKGDFQGPKEELISLALFSLTPTSMS